MRAAWGPWRPLLQSAREISFTISVMTVSSAVSLPLVLAWRSVASFESSRSPSFVLIFASGIVSLTPPLMCSGLLQVRGERAKKNWIERVIGGTEKRVLAVYGRWLWFFLRHRWISLAIWVICLLGTGYLFYIVPKAFLPIGDSSFALGASRCPEGRRITKMHTHQMQVEEVLHTNPAVDMTFTMSGNNAFFPANQGLVLAFWKPPDKRLLGLPWPGS